jgi:hypothetical protein
MRITFDDPVYITPYFEKPHVVKKITKDETYFHNKEKVGRTLLDMIVPSRRKENFKVSSSEFNERLKHMKFKPLPKLPLALKLDTSIPPSLTFREKSSGLQRDIAEQRSEKILAIQQKKQELDI